MVPANGVGPSDGNPDDTRPNDERDTRIRPPTRSAGSRPSLIQRWTVRTVTPNRSATWRGVSASSVTSRLSHRSARKDGTAAFDLPPKCAASGAVLPIGVTGLIAEFEMARRQRRRRWVLRSRERVH